MPGKYFPKQTGACGHPAQCPTLPNDLITKSCLWPQQVVLGARFVSFLPLGHAWLLSLLKFLPDWRGLILFPFLPGIDLSYPLLPFTDALNLRWHH